MNITTTTIPFWKTSLDILNYVHLFGVQQLTNFPFYAPLFTGGLDVLTSDDVTLFKATMISLRRDRSFSLNFEAPPTWARYRNGRLQDYNAQLKWP